MKKILILSLVVILTGCNGSMKRNSWQKTKDFKAKRELYYNQFVESGGMMPDESDLKKKTVQEALNQGSVLAE